MKFGKVFLLILTSILISVRSHCIPGGTRCQLDGPKCCSGICYVKATKHGYCVPAGALRR